MIMSICVYTSICEEDATWIGQFLQEMERLQLPHVIHFDRCSPQTKQIFAGSPLFVGHTSQDDPLIEFNERHKQAPFNEVVRLGFDWAFAMDVDETFEREAGPKLTAIQGLDCDYVDTPWVNLWGSLEFIRTDGPFSGGHRVKAYNLKSGLRWEFYCSTVNGARGLGAFEPREMKSDLVCLHWGMMTKELREMHRRRWDRIYTKASGRNPYGFWNYACDESIEVRTAKNEYLP